ncbi:hypothetical protein G7054_g12784 [Neopestalotiopsis clavispora]|nr:hypothetical protein G7054_g12784 [Neopestalotiopsis clavispora]
MPSTPRIAAGLAPKRPNPKADPAPFLLRGGTHPKGDIWGFWQERVWNQLGQDSPIRRVPAPSSHESNTWNPPAPLSSPHPDNSQKPMPDPQKPAKDSKKPATVVENALAAPEKSPFKQTGLSFGDAPVAPADRIHPFFYVKKPAPRDDHNLCMRPKPRPEILNYNDLHNYKDRGTETPYPRERRPTFGVFHIDGFNATSILISDSFHNLHSGEPKICGRTAAKVKVHALYGLAIKSRHDVDSIVDLAGTEGVKDVNMGVERKAEGQQINKGLEEVGRCLNSLTGSGPIVATSTFPNILRQNSGDRCRTA